MKYSFKIVLLFHIIFVFKQVTWAMSLDMLVFDDQTIFDFLANFRNFEIMV